MLLRPGIETDDRCWEIFFLGIVRGIPKEKTTADNMRAARFEEVSGVDIVLKS